MENSRKLYINLILLGILSWLIPFAVSFLFYNKQGELIVPYSTFKSSIMALGTMTGFIFFTAISG